MAKANSKEKKQRLERLRREKADQRELKKKRQTRTMFVVSCAVGAVVLALAVFFSVRGILRSPRPKEDAQGNQAGVLNSLQEDSAILDGYWWYDSESFFCIENGEYRSYSLNGDGSAFSLSSEYQAAVAEDTLILFLKESGMSLTPIQYSLEDDGKRLLLHYTTDNGDSYAPSFTAGDPPALPMLRGSDE